MRRVIVEQLLAGPIRLDARQSHHVRDVLRLGVGDRLELFDSAGTTASGVIVATEPEVLVNVTEPRRGQPTTELTIASAVPKGERADWLVEKLSELGTSRFVPMRCERSVVVPAGTSKAERWRRIAVESAKQSRRVGVMEIDPVRDFEDCLGMAAERRFIADASGDASLSQLAAGADSSSICLVGPEGGFSPRELQLAKAAGFRIARLTATVLRVETACIVAAAAILLGSANNPD